MNAPRARAPPPLASRFLVPLLLVHGNLSYYRLARLIKYSFYKNITFAFILFYYQFYCGFSGQALVDSITAAVFNVVFTSLPILLFAILDRPVKNLKAFIRFPQARAREAEGGWRACSSRMPRAAKAAQTSLRRRCTQVHSAAARPSRAHRPSCAAAVQQAPQSHADHALLLEDGRAAGYRARRHLLLRALLLALQQWLAQHHRRLQPRQDHLCVAAGHGDTGGGAGGALLDVALHHLHAAVLPAGVPIHDPLPAGWCVVASPHSREPGGGGGGVAGGGARPLRGHRARQAPANPPVAAAAPLPRPELGIGYYDPANIGVANEVLASPVFWFAILICYLLCFGMRYAERTADWVFKPHDSMILAEVGAHATHILAVRTTRPRWAARVPLPPVPQKERKDGLMEDLSTPTRRRLQELGTLGRRASRTSSVRSDLERGGSERSLPELGSLRQQYSSSSGNGLSPGVSALVQPSNAADGAPGAASAQLVVSPSTLRSAQVAPEDSLDGWASMPSAGSRSQVRFASHARSASGTTYPVA